MICGWGKARTRRRHLLPLLLAMLAFAGSQTAFVRAAFPHVPRAVQTAAWRQGTPWRAAVVVAPAHVPMHGSRRSARTVGPSDATAAMFPDAPIVISPEGRTAALLVPPSFVPPPPFHPPRAG